jgi:hypothetical protein
VYRVVLHQAENSPSCKPWSSVFVVLDLVCASLIPLRNPNERRKCDAAT